jgi:hypothetical protein
LRNVENFATNDPTHVVVTACTSISISRVDDTIGISGERKTLNVSKARLLVRPVSTRESTAMGFVLSAKLVGSHGETTHHSLGHELTVGQLKNVDCRYVRRIVGTVGSIVVWTTSVMETLELDGGLVEFYSHGFSGPEKGDVTLDIYDKTAIVGINGDVERRRGTDGVIHLSDVGGVMLEDVLEEGTSVGRVDVVKFEYEVGIEEGETHAKVVRITATVLVTLGKLNHLSGVAASVDIGGISGITSNLTRLLSCLERSIIVGLGGCIEICIGESHDHIMHRQHSGLGGGEHNCAERKQNNKPTHYFKIFFHEEEKEEIEGFFEIGE